MSTTKPAGQVAVARIRLAEERAAAGASDDALAWAVGALQAEPDSPEAASLIRKLLAVTVWNLPVAGIDHNMPVEQLAFAPPSSLWVGLAEAGADGFNSVVRWDLAQGRMAAVMFPVTGAETQGLMVGGDERFVVVRRGAGSGVIALLCDGATLRPIRELGPLPADLPAESVLVSSANGLLVAHPGPLSGTDSRVVWRIRDAATGEIIRCSEPDQAGEARALAAHLDARRLRLVRADGAVTEIPVSPVDPVSHHAAADAAALLSARMEPAGDGFFALVDRGLDRAPERRYFRIDRATDDAALRSVPVPAAEAPAPDGTPWLMDGGWSRHPSVWTSLLRDHGNVDDPPLIRPGGRDLVFCRSARAPLHVDAAITAAVFAPDKAIVGTAVGTVRIYQFMPRPEAGLAAVSRPEWDMAALAPLAALLAGVRLDEASGVLCRLTMAERMEMLGMLPQERAAAWVPGLDFSKVLTAVRAVPYREVPQRELLPLWERLARADLTGRSWPHLLALAQPLGDSRWHQDLTEAVALRAGTAREPKPGDPSPWLAQLRMREVFAGRDGAAITAAIQTAGGKGPAAATALALALDAGVPEWIEACLVAATDLPPVLRLTAASSVAWLRQNPSDAIALWPDEFPDYKKCRLTEDWDGWEQEDFLPRYQAQLQVIRGELASYEVRPDATPVERVALAARLLDPAARDVIGRRRLADYSLKAALALAAFPEDSTHTFQLANRARSLGAAPEPCLRAEALALTRLQDYTGAHPCWIKLLTEHPVATHVSADYAEAAYTAFETGDPNQALEILTTGINRFPDDADFALRAGWTALLTGNPGRAYQFLLAGLRIGYAEARRENSCLLLAVAAAQAGFGEDAAIHFQNLLKVAPVWAEPKTIEDLDWPDELKAALQELADAAD